MFIAVLKLETGMEQTNFDFGKQWTGTNLQELDRRQLKGEH